VEHEWLATLATVSEDEVTYVDFVEEGRRLAAGLRAEGAELVIALTHMRMPNDRRLAAEVEGIDLVLGGHDHNYVIDAVEPHGTLVVKSGTDFREFTRLDITLPDEGEKGRPEVVWERVEVNSSVTEDPDVAALVESYASKLGSSMGKTIGVSSVDLDGRFEVIRTQESNLGNFVTDVWRHSTGADVALLNSGTLRSDMVHPAGNVTLRDLVSILPMLDENVLLLIAGADLKAALENGVSMYPRLDGRFPQVSGMTFHFDPTREPGARVTEVRVGDEPLDEARKYKLAVKAYLVDGKDGYTSLTNGEVLIGGEESPYLITMVRNFFSNTELVEALVKSESLLKNAVRRFRSSLSPGKIVQRPSVSSTAISPATEGRIVNVAAA